ncbi:MAG: efflux RND transporter permease subunit [Chitinispirillales bacterium]|jgi:HAE1 family hydrophobic/amphiphilic exporter-1|nr:efflux RND transporter permease subunit [Chitinispirillales bacterium]
MSIAKTSIQRPLMMIMVILAVSLFGLVAWQKLPTDRMPNIELPYVTIQFIYPGSGPEEVELNVIKPVEDQVGMISGIKNMTSYCMENAGVIVLEFNTDINADFAAIEVKDKVSQIMSLLPEDVKEPAIAKIDFSAMPIMTIALLGDSTISPIELRTYADKQLKDKFGQVVGVAQATISGGREREIHVTLNAEKLAAHNLSIFNVYPVFTMQNALVPIGYVTGELKEYSVKFDGKFRTIEEIEQIQVPTPGGYNVRLNEIAKVSDSYADVREAARFQGEQSVEFSITKSGDANTVATAKKVIKTLEKQRKELPQGMRLEIVTDQSNFISEAVSDTYSNIWQGILLTAIILLIFLSDFRLTIIAAVIMPISLIMGFIGMDAMGFSMNMVTMMSLTIVVGILVTNAIVVLENIMRHRNMGKDPHHAALAGTDEIFVAVLASTLTNLAVFIPIASTTGMTGSIFKELGLTIVFATVASLILSFTLVPIMAAFMLKPKEEGKEHAHAIDKFISGLDKKYENMLDKALNNRTVKIGIVVFTFLLLIFTMKVVASKIGVDFMPHTDEGFINISVELPVGTPMSVTQDVLVKIEDKLKDLPYLKAISSSIGKQGISSGVQSGEIRIELVPLAERDIDVFRMVRQVRPKIADIPDAKIMVAAASGMNRGQSSTDLEIQILGNNMDTLAQLAETALKFLETDNELTDFNSSWKGAKPEILITPKREIMEHYGLMGNISSSISGQIVGGILRYNVTGEETAKYSEEGEEYPIRVRLDENSRKDIRDIATMNIMTPKGMVPLEVIANVEYAASVSQITRINKQKMLNVTANAVSRDIAMGTKTPQVLKMLAEKAPLPEEYTYKTAGNQDFVDETMGQLAIAAALAVALTLMLLIALLESIPMGIVIFMTLPLGLIGVIWALFITHSTLSMISMLSVIMLIGVVVNNAILMIDYARQLRNENHISPHDAIVKAAGTKLKAILMSNIAIVVSMIPMALGLGAGGTFRAPFAITAIGGVIISTMLTFFVIPVLYVWTAPKHEDEVL